MAEPPSGTITLLFSDIEGSTLLLRRLGDGYAELLARHRQLLREALERHGGHVLESEGDAFFVAFESATEAAVAAADAQRALAGNEWPADSEIRVHIGEAAEVLEQAAEVFERKGNITSLDKARRTRADLER
jgi:class 3 adenylate cyclase